MSWHNGPLCGWDLETTGVQVEEDRIVQAAIVIVDASKKLVQADVQLVNPGIDIPAEATAVHGISTERARAEGGDPATVLEHYADELTAAQEIGVPLVGANLVYDFTLFDRELRRHGLRTLEQRLGRPLSPVVDVMVLDKLCHRFRKGGRKLTDLCTHYGVKHDGAHDAGADALAACRIAWRMVQWGSLPDSHFIAHPGITSRDMATVPGAYRKLAALSLPELHAAQVRAKVEQDRGLAQYFKDKNQDYSGLDGHWPMIPFAFFQQAIA
jgi:DNA polymerase III subunit epsilon